MMKMKRRKWCLSPFLVGMLVWGQGDRDLGVVAAGKTVRAVVIGDFGYDGDDSGQVEVAKAIEALHGKSRFQVGLTVGDNFYPNGVESTADPHWKLQFHDQYDRLGIPFFAVLGNHDYMGNPEAQVEYTNAPKNKTWKMPFRYYSFGAGPVRFFGLDTDEGTIGLFKSKEWSQEQRSWLDAQLAKHAGARWKVVYGHHPIFSDGHHGDTKRLYQQLMPLLLKHRVDVYLAGHDHDMQHFEKSGIQFFVVGGGGKDIRKIKKKRAVYAESTHGFMEMEASENQLVMRLIGGDGRLLHSKALKK